MKNATAASAEIVLKLAKPVAGRRQLGISVRFEGIPSAFSPEPFLLTMDSEPGKINGIEVTPCSPARPAR